MNTDIIINIDK